MVMIEIDPITLARVGLAGPGPGESERELMFGKSRSAWNWCLHCERCYPAGYFRVVDQGYAELQLCPYFDCDGDAVIDAWEWRQIAKMNGYPAVPELGAVYPMYGPCSPDFNQGIPGVS